MPTNGPFVGQTVQTSGHTPVTVVHLVDALQDRLQRPRPFGDTVGDRNDVTSGNQLFGEQVVIAASFTVCWDEDDHWKRPVAGHLRFLACLDGGVSQAHFLTEARRQFDGAHGEIGADVRLAVVLLGRWKGIGERHTEQQSQHAECSECPHGP